MAVVSPFANLHQSIISRMALKVPLVRYVAPDVGQLDHYDTRPNVSFPALLFEAADDFNFTDDAGKFIQEGVGIVVFRLALAQYTSGSNLTPSDIRENALQYYEYEQQIFAAFHGWSPDGFGRFKRRKSQKELRRDSLLVRRIAYEIGFTDESAKPLTTKVKLGDGSININPDPGGEFNEDFNNDFTI